MARRKRPSLLSDDEHEPTDRLYYLRKLREHQPGCCCWLCVTVLELWVIETTREQRDAYEADTKRRVRMAEFTLQQQIQCVDRELSMRQKVYPRQVSTGKMKADDAEYHISQMRAVLKTLQWLEKNRTVIMGAVEKAKEVAS